MLGSTQNALQPNAYVLRVTWTYRYLFEDAVYDPARKANDR